MKAQQFGKPDVSLSWFIKEDSYTRDRCKITLESEEGKKQLVDTILMLLDQEKEIRIGTDCCCLILEANDADEEYSDASYQYVDNEETMAVLRKSLPDGSYILCLDEDDYNYQLNEFLKKNPEYEPERKCIDTITGE